MFTHSPSFCMDPFISSVALTIIVCVLYADLSICKSENRILERLVKKYSHTSLIRTPKGQNQVSALQRCPYYRGRECMIFGISGTKQTVRNREVSVL